jgi:hypothetical protein
VNTTTNTLRDSIRAEVGRVGCCVVQPQQLRLLCSDELTMAELFACIAAVSREEGWSFSFLPGGAVEFGTLVTA